MQAKSSLSSLATTLSTLQQAAPAKPPRWFFLAFYLEILPQVRAFEPKKWRRLGPSTWPDKVKCCIIKRSQKSCFYCQPARQPRPPETHRQPCGHSSWWQIGPDTPENLLIDMKKDLKTTKVGKYILLQLFSHY